MWSIYMMENYLAIKKNKLKKKKEVWHRLQYMILKNIILSERN